MKEPVLDAALRYARAGWPVFPCRPRDKRPLTADGFKSATTDTATITQWWTEHPDANVAIRTGDGLAVVDVDGPDGERALQELGGLSEPTLTAETAHGQHFYFTTTETLSCRTRFAPGLDLRADGGYVIAPPSQHPSGAPYRWVRKSKLRAMPARVLRAIRENGRGPAEPLPDKIPIGQRDAVLTSLAGSMRRRGASEDGILAALTEENGRCAEPLDVAQLKKIARSVARYEPAPVPTPEKPVSASPVPAAAVAVVRRLPDLLALGDDEEEPADWIVRGLFAREVVTGITGKPKSGKTTFLLHALTAIGQGRDFLGMPVKRTPVLWCNLEMSERLLRWKLRGIASGDTDIDLFAVTGTRRELTPAFVEQQIAALGVGLVVIDSLGKWWDVQDESDNVGIERGIDAALQLARRTGCGIVPIHHSPKHRKSGMTVMDMFRGGGALGAALDLGVMFSKQGDSRVRKLEFEGRFDDSPGVLHAELTETGYVLAQSPAEIEAAQQRDQILDVWDGRMTVKQVLADLRENSVTISDATVRKRLDELVAAHAIARLDEKDGKAFVYVRAGPQAA